MKSLKEKKILISEIIRDNKLILIEYNFKYEDIKEHLELFQALITCTELSQDEILENFIKICGDWEK